MTIQKQIDALNNLDLRMSSMGYLQALMGWDSMTIASKKGLETRSQVMGNISSLFFTTLINNDVKSMLDKLNDQTHELDETTLAKLKLYTKSYEQIAKIPMEEFATFSALKAKSGAAWEEAKNNDDFSKFAPFLKDVLETEKRFVNYRGYEGHPYNTLLDDYESGLTVEIADQFFAELKKTIVPLVKQISEKELPVFPFLQESYSTDKQSQFSNYIMEQLGFRMDCGLVAESEHPFTMNLSRNDVRITTHYYEKDLNSSISSTIHETGHALYEQNISEEFGVSALTAGTSMGIHESQSRIYENNFGRNLNFWKKYYPKLQETYPEQLKNVTVEDYHRSLNTVKPSFIRIEADEVTYPLHIMIRYELEKMIMTEDFNVNDLPEKWNDKYEEYMGIRPANNVEGILQDVHWSEGLFGYFPSYALGSAYAAQFEFYMRKDINVDSCLASGDMSPILDWLASHVHKYGSSKEPAEIIRLATGEDFNPKYFTDYLKNKYSAIYNL